MLCEVGLGMFVVLFNSCGLVVDTLYRHTCFDDECVILKFNYTSCACLSCCLHKELVSIVGSYCTISLKSLVATLHLYIYIYITWRRCEPLQLICFIFYCLEEEKMETPWSILYHSFNSRKISNQTLGQERIIMSDW